MPAPQTPIRARPASATATPAPSVTPSSHCDRKAQRALRHCPLSAPPPPPSPAGNALPQMPSGSRPPPNLCHLHQPPCLPASPAAPPPRPHSSPHPWAHAPLCLHGPWAQGGRAWLSESGTDVSRMPRSRPPTQKETGRLLTGAFRAGLGAWGRGCDPERKAGTGRGSCGGPRAGGLSPQRWRVTGRLERWRPCEDLGGNEEPGLRSSEG